MTKTIIIDARYGYEIVWLAHYEGLKVVLRTIIFNLFRVSFNAFALAWYSFTLGVCIRHVFMDKYPGDELRFSLSQITQDTK